MQNGLQNAMQKNAMQKNLMQKNAMQNAFCILHLSFR